MDVIRILLILLRNYKQLALRQLLCWAKLVHTSMLLYTSTTWRERPTHSVMQCPTNQEAEITQAIRTRSRLGNGNNLVSRLNQNCPTVPLGKSTLITSACSRCPDGVASAATKLLKGEFRRLPFSRSFTGPWIKAPYILPGRASSDHPIIFNMPGKAFWLIRRNAGTRTTRSVLLKVSAAVGACKMKPTFSRATSLKLHSFAL